MRRELSFIDTGVASLRRTRRDTPLRNGTTRRPQRMSLGKLSLGTGGSLLCVTLLNRLLLTPTLPSAQSRSDILSVIACGSLILYGLGKLDVTERKSRVEMGGVYGKRVLAKDSAVEVLLMMLLEGVKAVRSVALVRREGDASYVGRFDCEEPVIGVGGVVERVWDVEGGRVYMADMNIVPVKSSEFGFLPGDCQVSFCLFMRVLLMRTNIGIRRCWFRECPIRRRCC